MKILDERINEVIKMSDSASSYFEARTDVINSLRDKVQYFYRDKNPDSYDKAHGDVYSELLNYLLDGTVKLCTNAMTKEMN